MTIRRIVRELSVVGVSILLVLTLSACGGGDGSGSSGSNAAGFSLSVGPNNPTVAQDAEILLKVSLTRNPGFTDPISVTVDQAAAGIESDTLTLPGTIDSGHLPILVGSGVAIGTVPVQVVARSGGASATASTLFTVVPPEPSSQEKINAAVAAGTLDYGTSLLYRAYARWGDRRLPGIYRGLGVAEEDNGLFREIRDSLTDLPTSLQTQLRPFIVRPSDPESVWNDEEGRSRSKLAVAEVLPPSTCPPQSGAERSWISKRSGLHPVRVWTQCVGRQADDAESERLVDKTLGLLNKVYGPMTALMGEPILDQGGGDEAIDFYILDSTAYVYRGGEFDSIAPKNFGEAECLSSPVGGNAQSGYVLLQHYLPYMSFFHETLIHELFHVLQCAHNPSYAVRAQANVSGLKEMHWFVEASATWAAAYFDRVLAPWERGRAAFFVHRRFTNWFQPKQLGLNALQPKENSYSSYIWPYFVEQETGGPAFMRQIWDRLRTTTTFEQADDAIDSVYSFPQNFKRFALRNLNTAFTPGDPLPSDKRYVRLDPEQFPDGKEPSYLLRGELIADKDQEKAISLPNLSAGYLRMSILSSGIRKVEFDFSGLQPAGFVDVQALVRTVGGWVSEPLDLGSSKATFCFDKGPTTTTVRGSFEEIVLVIANHGKREGSKVAGNLTVRPKSTPCSPFPDYVGTTSFVATGATGGKGPSPEGTAQVTWEFVSYNPDTKGAVYHVREGTLSIEGPSYLAFDNCPFTISPKTVAVTKINSAASTLVVNHGTNPPTFGITAATAPGADGTPMLTYTVTCPNSNPFSGPTGGVFWALPLNPPPLNANADGTVLQGVTQGQPNGLTPVFTYTHSYQAVTPP